MLRPRPLPRPASCALARRPSCALPRPASCGLALLPLLLLLLSACADVEIHLAVGEEARPAWISAQFSTADPLVADLLRRQLDGVAESFRPDERQLMQMQQFHRREAGLTVQGLTIGRPRGWLGAERDVDIRLDGGRMHLRWTLQPSGAVSDADHRSNLGITIAMPGEVVAHSHGTAAGNRVRIEAPLSVLSAPLAIEVTAALPGQPAPATEPARPAEPAHAPAVAPPSPQPADPVPFPPAVEVPEPLPDVLAQIARLRQEAGLLGTDVRVWYVPDVGVAIRYVVPELTSVAERARERVAALGLAAAHMAPLPLPDAAWLALEAVTPDEVLLRKWTRGALAGVWGGASVVDVAAFLEEHYEFYRNGVGPRGALSQWDDLREGLEELAEDFAAQIGVRAAGMLVPGYGLLFDGAPSPQLAPVQGLAVLAGLLAAYLPLPEDSHVFVQYEVGGDLWQLELSPQGVSQLMDLIAGRTGELDEAVFRIFLNGTRVD